MKIRLNYTERGFGKPLILLHGNRESLEYFEKQMEYFWSDYHVIAIDTRGHGKSPRGDRPFTIRQFAEDLKHFMDFHKIEKAHILGFSDGGNIALCFALKYPERVDKLILNGANLYSAGVKPSVQVPIIVEYKIASFLAKRNLKSLKKAEMYGLMVNDPNIEPAELHDLKNPTLVIAGTKDMIKDEHTHLIFESLPNAQLVLIEGDHFIASKKADEFNAAVGSFLKG